MKASKFMCMARILRRSRMEEVMQDIQPPIRNVALDSDLVFHIPGHAKAGPS